jgi:hypothetical protein
MTEQLDRLMAEFLSWVSCRRRTYREVMEAWRSTCPRLTVWEDGLREGLVQVEGRFDGSEVTLTPRGRGFLDARSHARAQGAPSA